ncbi:conserved Plasmodium protein, unknown function [Plasmodium knowlesi strain H]|uniref:HTH OST-type domain-containing protein n=3 Tax=Plasmodium knowlesi TaxID=5850 RepID=A0A5K1VQW6_PLAKH|nr:conserved Plasmodium protein, unknown function [Plasmodium knowlesi strain H]OTN67638.1 Uncharacterized protein PKNOH_S05381800 [Plasmodium knowlesi]CAA9990409.1 conserved Plasmodium protein, unknown function [Plasmodium knowlesi strain H]SBO19615.1 conserved Plasmodium protein, unknown function [Plasmodium knowlesi strain H]SBO22598.1 conserved Plasmodium protein, unknown function [Plasmodium knowlesi strain H]VVS79883.1 conserved Plasmodium protein, unknown function [Plasmodium knowlesi s|eukprot:XP_002260809.1 hypothetical protein, conserved in Plasmodium species [Plasmodium knowlesi strain H]
MNYLEKHPTRMKKTTKRINQNTIIPLKHQMTKDVDTISEAIKGKSKENEKAGIGKNSEPNDEVENFDYIKSYLTEVFERTKTNDSVSSKEDSNMEDTHRKSREHGENTSLLHTENNSLNVECDLDNTYEFETMESGSYPNGDVQLVEAIGEVEMAQDVGVASAGASFSGGSYAHPLRLKKALTSVDEQNYNIFGSKSLFNHFGTFNRSGNPGVWLTDKEEIYNAPNGECRKMAEGNVDLLIDDVVRGSCLIEPGENFDQLEEEAFNIGRCSEEQESNGVNVEQLLAEVGGSNGHVDGLETVQRENPQEMNSNLFQLLSSSNREFVCNYIRRYQEMGERGEEGGVVEGADGEGHMEGRNSPPVDGYVKGKSVCFDLPTTEHSIMLNDHDIGTYVQSDGGNEVDIGYKLESSRLKEENICPSGKGTVEIMGNNINQDNLVKHDLGGIAHLDHKNVGGFKKHGYEHNDSNVPSFFFIPEWVRSDQGETCMKGTNLDKGNIERKRSISTLPNHVAPTDEWDEKTPSVSPHIKKCTTSELYNNLLELLNDGSQNVKVDSMNQEIGMHLGGEFVRDEAATYYDGDILKHVTHGGERDSHVDDQQSGGNHAFIRRANYEVVEKYAKGLNGVDNAENMSKVERGITMGNINSGALPVKSYLKYQTTPFSISHDNERDSFQNRGQSTYGSPPPIVTKKKNVMFEALKNKIGFLLDNEDDDVFLSEYIKDAIDDYNRSKWGRGANGRESMQAGRSSFGEGKELVYNPVRGESDIATETEIQNGILKSETINYNYSRPTEHLSEVDLRDQNHSTVNLHLGRAHTDTYNEGYSHVDRIRGESPPQGAGLEIIREDQWRAKNFNRGRAHVKNRTHKSNVASLKLFLQNSIMANNISNYSSGNISGYTVGQRSSLDKGILSDDSASGPNGDDMKGGWNGGPVVSDVPMKTLEERKSPNVGSSQLGDYSIERGDAIRGHLRKANKEEEREEQLKKIYENLFFLSRRNNRNLPFSSVSRVEQEGTTAQDASTDGYVLPLHGENSSMKIHTSAHSDDSFDALSQKGGDTSFLKRDLANLKAHGTFGISGRGNDALSGVVGSFEKGHFVDEVGSNWSNRNFMGKDKGIGEGKKREGILFGGRRGDPSLSRRGKDAFEEEGANNSLWNRNLVSGSSAMRATYSAFVNRVNGGGSEVVHRGRYALLPSPGSSILSGIDRNSNDRNGNGRMDRAKSQDRRGISNTRGKKKYIEARNQLSVPALKAYLSKEDKQDLERLLESLYADRIIPLVINLKGRADEYNFNDVLKNNIINAYGLFPDKYTVKEHHPSSSASSSSAPHSDDNCLVHFLHRKVDDDYFFSINDTVDRYDPKLWNEFEKYLLEIASSDDPQLYSFTGGRYGMAKELQRRKLPFFQGLYLGHLCHIVHISATRKIIAYENNFIKPISQCRKYEDAKMGIVNTRGGNAKNYIASMDELKFYLGAILKSHKRGINISTLKAKMLSSYNKRLCESVFHCVKLVELLQMEELKDICVVDMESRVLHAVPAP